MHTVKIEFSELDYSYGASREFENGTWLFPLHIPVMRNHSSGELETACPELETALDHHLLAKQFI
jgi:hypothetical protein